MSGAPPNKRLAPTPVTVGTFDLAGSQLALLFSGIARCWKAGAKLTHPEGIR